MKIYDRKGKLLTEFDGDLRDADLSDANLSNADLSDAKLPKNLK